MSDHKNIRPWVRWLIAHGLRWVALALVILATPMYFKRRIAPEIPLAWADLVGDFVAIRDFEP